MLIHFVSCHHNLVWHTRRRMIEIWCPFHKYLVLAQQGKSWEIGCILLFGFRNHHIINKSKVVISTCFSMWVKIHRKRILHLTFYVIHGHLMLPVIFCLKQKELVILWNDKTVPQSRKPTARWNVRCTPVPEDVENEFKIAVLEWLAGFQSCSIVCCRHSFTISQSITGISNQNHL